MKVEGVNDVVRALHDMGAVGSRRTLTEALKRGAEPIRDRASSLAKRAPGEPDLADHITISVGRTTDEHTAVVLVGPTKEERSDQPGKTFDAQGRFLEFGTSDTAAQPFLRPALDGEGHGAAAEILEELWRELVAQGAVGGRGTGSGSGL